MGSDTPRYVYGVIPYICARVRELNGKTEGRRYVAIVRASNVNISPARRRPSGQGAITQGVTGIHIYEEYAGFYAVLARLFRIVNVDLTRVSACIKLVALFVRDRNGKKTVKSTV